MKKTTDEKKQQRKDAEENKGKTKQFSLPFLESKSNEFFSCDPRDIIIREELNIRKDYGDIESLADNIKINGIKTPVSCFKENGKWILVDGFRRMRAVNILLERGTVIRVPIISAGKPADMKPEAIVLRMMATGDTNKKLNAVELAEGVNRLLSYKIKEEEIAKRTGYSPAYICNLKLLATTATDKIKKAIISERISPTLVVQTLRKSDNGVKVLETILDKSLDEIDAQDETLDTGTDSEKTKKKSRSTNPTGRQKKCSKDRITAQDIEKHEKAQRTGSAAKHDSVKYLKKIITKKEYDSLELRKENQKLFEFGYNLITGVYSHDDLVDLFYETPSSVEPPK